MSKSDVKNHVDEYIRNRCLTYRETFSKIDYSILKRLNIQSKCLCT